MVRSSASEGARTAYDVRQGRSRFRRRARLRSAPRSKPLSSSVPVRHAIDSRIRMPNQTCPNAKISVEQPVKRSTERGPWSALFTFFMEGFALYGAAMHPTAVFHVQSFLTKEETSESTESSFPEQPSISPASPSDASRSGRWNWLSPFW